MQVMFVVGTRTTSGSSYSSILIENSPNHSQFFSWSYSSHILQSGINTYTLEQEKCFFVEKEAETATFWF